MRAKFEFFTFQVFHTEILTLFPGEYTITHIWNRPEPVLMAGRKALLTEFGVFTTDWRVVIRKDIVPFKNFESSLVVVSLENWCCWSHLQLLGQASAATSNGTRDRAAAIAVVVVAATSSATARGRPHPRHDTHLTFTQTLSLSMCVSTAALDIDTESYRFSHEILWVFFRSMTSSVFRESVITLNLSL